MLTKQAKYVRSLHDDYFVTERRIAREIGKLQKKARTDFKKMLKKIRRNASVRFSSLHDEAFTKDWDAIISVSPVNNFMSDDEFKQFCLLASEKIGVTFEFSKKIDQN